MIGWFGWFMVFNATFNNISVISRRLVLLVQETRVPKGNHRQTLSLNGVSSTPCCERGFELTTLVVIGTDCTCSCKSKYHTIMATTAPLISMKTYSWCKLTKLEFFSLYVMNIKYIMYICIKFNIMTPCSFNNATHPAVCEGWNFTHMWPHYFTNRVVLALMFLLKKSFYVVCQHNPKYLIFISSLILINYFL
jgi:hypothetical protein